jgi:type IV pilus assembly protein PilY1
MCNPSYGGYCATTTDNWATTNWVAKEYADAETCFRKKYTEYCGDIKVPQVIDPSDTPDETAETANVPAIIAEIGVEAQLGSPIAELKVNNYDTTAPTGLLDEFSDKIRFGAMIFNHDGSDYECDLSSTDKLNCPKVCSTTTSRTCNSDLDCPSGESCIPSTSNSDAGEIIHYIGEGTCSVTTSTACVRDDQCPIDETCVSAVGDHDTGLIKAIDDIRANTWTPFAEAYYNAIGYFVKDATDNPRLDAAKFTASGDAIEQPLNTNDVDSNKNCIEYECQKNNILIISDGASTSDIHSTMTAKVTVSSLYDDGDMNDSATCGDYSGSSYLDDLSYYAHNRNIFDPSDSDPTDDDLAQSITTYVVYTGPETSTETGECAPKTLMEDTALNGGTVLYQPQDPSALASSLISTFQQVASGSASGTAVSVLATTSEGEGAVYQAYFYPEKMEGIESRKWLGYVHALFVDIWGNLREDSDNDGMLDLTADRIVEMVYASDLGSVVNTFIDLNGDGEKDSPIPSSTVSLDNIKSIWRGGEELWNTDPSSRSIFTTVDGITSIDFTTANSATLLPYLRAADAPESDNIINWTLGEDLGGITDTGHPYGYRNRNITIGGNTKVWKLGGKL